MNKYEATQNMGLVRSSDLSRGITLRNASENRRLVGHLQHLDLQLHSNLVNLQAEISELRLSQYRHRLKTTTGKTAIGKTWSDPRQRQISNRQFENPSGRISPLVVQGRSKEISSKPFLPQIGAHRTALVRKQADGPVRPNSPKSPSCARRFRAVPKSVSHLSTGAKSNLYRPNSSPNLNATSSVFVGASGSVPRGDDTRQIHPSRKASGMHSKSSDDLSASPLELTDRVSDFLKRPNKSSGDRMEREEHNEFTHAVSDEIPTIKIEQEEEVDDDEANAESADNENQPFPIDEELFRNSLLLKASRDDGLSHSMPDLASLGFMDFNEVIDQRLRKLQEEIPSQAEMRKIRYLRFRDEPAALHIKEIFEKETHQKPEKHLDKIDE